MKQNFKTPFVRAALIYILENLITYFLILIQANMRIGETYIHDKKVCKILVRKT